jgi:hypothetical protein
MNNPAVVCIHASDGNRAADVFAFVGQAFCLPDEIFFSALQIAFYVHLNPKFRGVFLVDDFLDQSLHGTNGLPVFSNQNAGIAARHFVKDSLRTFLDCDDDTRTDVVNDALKDLFTCGNMFFGLWRRLRFASFRRLFD